MKRMDGIMEKNKKLKITDTSGKTSEYDIITAFFWTKTKKNYIVYTDNTKNENNDLNVYASIYNPNDLTKLEDINSDDEWSEVEKRLKNISNGRGEIYDKHY